MKYIAAILLLMFLCGCEPPPSEGIVVSKEHKEAYSTTGYRNIGSRRFPYKRKHPESWMVTFKGVTKSGVEMDQTVKVSKEVFDTTELGAHFKSE